MNSPRGSVDTAARGCGGTATTELAVLLLESSPEAADDILLQTTVRVPDGQTVVVGNAVPSASDRTIILVVRPEIGE
jgi:hypothetical protein